MAGSARGGRSAARSRKTALGAAFIARGLAGNPSRDPATGRKKSPGLIGSFVLTVVGGVFLGVGLYVHSHSATLRSQPGTKGSPAVMGWIFIGIGGLVVLLGGLTLISRIVSLLIGIVLLIAGRFERPEPAPTGPAGGAAPAPFTAQPGGAGSAPLMPPPLDPRLPGAGG